MEKSDALNLLGASEPLERLRGARSLARLAVEEDRLVLESAVQSETDSWVLHALKRILDRLNGHISADDMAATLPQTKTEDERFLSDVRAQITEEISRLLLHELRPLVGVVDQRAADEVADYTNSTTSAGLDHIKSFLRAIERLNQVSAAPRSVEFELGEVVYATAKTEAENQGIPLSQEGVARGHTVSEEDAQTAGTCTMTIARRDPVVLYGDPDLISLALANVLRNAIEATLDSGSQESVIVSFGVTDHDVWIAVLDQGIGLPKGAEQIFEIGKTSKSKDHHHGFGLSITRRAMDSMRGSIDLRPRSDGGTAAELRWPIERK